MRELEKYRKDPRYKKYVGQVEKTLQSFDREVNEWADFIAFLGKLSRAFQAYPQFPIIPKKLVVGKRLAQSLNPALPPGVHQKALEVYDYIFDSIGIEQLADDLPIYSQGLFPFLQYAAMNVKPQLLALYEKHFFPLRDRLKPVTKAFITALLPGLEEEGSEFFDKVLSLLDHLSGIVERPYFLQSMWLILMTSPALRTPALNYLSRRMPKITSKEDVTAVLGDDIGIMIRAFSATLEDKHVLVQRAILDLLVTSFPLKVKDVGEIIQEDDLTLLMKYTSAVVLRKDMSLNRRLYAWLLGPDEHVEQQIEHFNKYGKNAVVSALKSLFFLDTNDLATAQRPYKILISLMDKWEIGQPIVQELLIDILWSLKNHVDKSEFGVELLQTANMFFEMIEPYLIWMKLYGLVQDRFSAQDGLDTSALELVDFVLNSFRMYEDEIGKIHLPLFVTSLLYKLQMFASETDFNHRISQTESALLLSLDLLQKIPSNVFSYCESSIIKDSQENTSSKVSLTKSQITYAETDSINEEIVQTSQLEVDFHTGMDALKYISDFYLYGNGKGNENPSKQFNEFSGIRGQLLVEELLNAIQGFLHNVITKAILVKNESSQDITPSQLVVIMDRSCSLLKAVSMRLHLIENTSKGYKELVSKLFNGEWVFSLLKCCYMVNNFEIIDSALSTIIHIIIDQRLISPSLIDSKQQIRVIVDTLWSFLAPNKAALHLRTVQLIWSLKDLSQANYVEAVISEYLIQKDPSARLSNFERFGTFWRLSENFQDTDLQFSQPMFLMLDTLRDENPTNRRAGEAWLRYNNKSYMRILGPIIKILCDPSILRRRAEIIISVETFQFFYYERAFNQAQVDYVFEMLSTICRVGGDSFLKAIRKNYIKPDLAKSCSWLSEDENEVAKAITYSEFFIKTALLYLESEVSQTLSSMSVLNEYTHVHATDFLNHLISKTKYVDKDLVHFVHDGLLRKILFCIYSKKLDLQSRLLHLLCITIPNVGAVNESSKKNSVTNSPYSSSPPNFDNLVSKEEADTKKNIRSFRTAGSSRSLIKVLLDALSIHYNRPLLQQWMQFIVTSLPYFRHSFNSILVPLIQCICEQLSRWKTEMQNHYAFIADNDQSDVTKYNKRSGDLTMSEWDIITLLNGFEKIVMFCLKDGGLANAGDSSSASPKAYESFSGFGNLFSIDTSHTEPTSSEQKPRDYILCFVFPNIVSIILDIWSVFKNVYSPNRPPKVGTDPFLITLSHTGDRTQKRIMKLLDKLHKNAHAELIEAFVELWYIENPSSNSSQETLNKSVESTVIDVMKVIPGSSPQKVITTLLVSARGRAQGAQSSRVKKLGAKANKISDIMILRFLEIYCDSLELSQPLIEVWPQCLVYAKDHTAQASSYKYLFPALLRFIHKLSDKLCSTVYFEDKKVRRDMQDVYQRIVEYCIWISGRSFDQGIWLRRPVSLDGEVESVEVIDERESEPGSSVNLITDEKKVVSKSKEEILIDQINHYFATVVVPNIKRLLIDQDRIVTIFGNMMYYIITPVLKNRSSNGIPNVILNIICEMSKLSFAYRVWRKEIWDVFIDNRFFNMTPGAAKKWRVIMQTIMTSEKERFPELLGRLSTSPANALFVSKEQESLNRALNLRRLSFVIYCGNTNQYLPYLPTMQEKLVELFKLGLSELVHAEIYLTLRILMCRISNHHLSNFWPVILTELVRLFVMFLQKESIEQSSEVANVFLAACKFLDLLFVLQIDDFQVYEWMFISNTINVVNHALEWSPYALMDKLAGHLLGQQEDLSKLNLDNIVANPVRVGSPVSRTPTFSNGESKRPMLTLKSITSIRQLEFFVKNVSLYVYRSIYTLAKPDIQYIESLLENDMLEYGNVYNSVELGSIDVGSGEIFT